MSGPNTHADAAKNLIELWRGDDEPAGNEIERARIVLAVMQASTGRVQIDELSRQAQRKQEMLQNLSRTEQTAKNATPSWLVRCWQWWHDGDPVARWGWVTTALIVLVAAPLAWMVLPPDADFDQVSTRGAAQQIAISDFDAATPRIIAQLQATGTVVQWSRKADGIEMIVQPPAHASGVRDWEMQWGVVLQRQGNTIILLTPGH